MLPVVAQFRWFLLVFSRWAKLDKSVFLHYTGIIDVFKAPMSSNSDHFWAEKGSFWPPKTSFFENFIFEVIFRWFSVFLENMRILIDSKATKCRNNVDFGSKKLDFWNSQEYRFFELEMSKFIIIRFSLNMLNSLMKWRPQISEKTWNLATTVYTPHF